MMRVSRHRFGLLLLSTQGACLGLDRRRAAERRLRGVNPRAGRDRADDAIDSAPPLDAGAAQEERRLSAVEANGDQFA
jgi:hypothetical protein